MYFKLTLVRPVVKDITKPRVNKLDEYVDFVGGAGRIERAFRTAINSQLTE